MTHPTNLIQIRPVRQTEGKSLELSLVTENGITTVYLTREEIAVLRDRLAHWAEAL